MASLTSRFDRFTTRLEWRMKYFELIARNLRRRFGRTILVVLTIAIAAVVFAILVAVPASMDRIINSAAAGQRLYIVNRAGPAPTYGVPGKYCHDIRSMPHVAACAAEWDWFMTYRSPSDWINLTPSDIEILDLAPDYHGSPEEYAHFRSEKRAAALGTEIMRKYGWRVGQTIMLRDSDGLDFEFVIVSMLPSRYYPNAFLVRRDYLEDVYKARHGNIGDAARLVVRVDTADNLGAVGRSIDERYRNSEAETRRETESELLMIKPSFQLSRNSGTKCGGIVTKAGSTESALNSLALMVQVKFGKHEVDISTPAEEAHCPRYDCQLEGDIRPG